MAEKKRLYIILEGGMVTFVGGAGFDPETHEYVVCDYDDHIRNTDCDPNIAEVEQDSGEIAYAYVGCHPMDEDLSDTVRKSLDEFVSKQED